MGLDRIFCLGHSLPDENKNYLLTSTKEVMHI